MRNREVQRLLGRIPIGLLISLAASATSPLARPASADSRPIQILHTNDLHSHFRPERTPLALGGVARLKTAIDRFKQLNSDTLVVDAGDWSEGSIYYFEGAGRESARMMDALGYDAMVVGNHDWLNGPDVLLRILNEAQPRVALLGANMDASGYAKAGELSHWVPPYVMAEVGGVRVAMIGLLTHEYVYDHYLSPVKITDPARAVERLTHELRPKADVIFALSHNRITVNAAILRAAPELDFIVGGHDHQRLNQPLPVERRNARPGWIVETGAWGHHLGRMTILAERGVPGARLAAYQLVQLDRTVPESDRIGAMIDRIETAIESWMGPVFHDDAGECDADLGREGGESPMLAFTTDAYRRFAGAELAIDSAPFVYDGLPQGHLRTADFVNAAPAIFDPATRKSWTLHTLSISFRRLKALFSLFLASRRVPAGLVNVSGAEIVYDPLRLEQAEVWQNGWSQKTSAPVPSLEAQNWIAPIESFKIGGREPLGSEMIRVAVSGGVLETFRFINSIVPGTVPMDDLKDTGVEAWRVLRDQTAANGRVERGSVQLGRIRPLAADLAIYSDQINYTASLSSQQSLQTRLRVAVRNLGYTKHQPIPSRAKGVQVLGHAGRLDLGMEPTWTALGAEREVPELAPGESTTLEWDVEVPGDAGLYPVLVKITGADEETVTANNTVLKWLTPQSAKP